MICSVSPLLLICPSVNASLSLSVKRSLDKSLFVTANCDLGDELGPRTESAEHELDGSLCEAEVVFREAFLHEQLKKHHCASAQFPTTRRGVNA